MDVLPPRWLDVQDEVTEQLGEISKQIKRLDQLHQKHVLPGFDDEDVKAREEREIERLTQDITRGFQTCQRAIKRIDIMLKETAQRESGLSKGEETMARNLKVSLASRVGDASANFRKKQSAYLKSKSTRLRCKASANILTELRAIGGFGSPNPLSRTSTPTPANPYTDPAMQESYEDTSLSRTTLLQTAQKRSHVRSNSNDAMIAQREREIEDIAQGIIELASIFQDLNAMVIDQGSMLDRIDYNVERMAADVKGADQELTVATNYQRRSVKRKAMLLLVLLIVGAFILLGLKLGSRSSSSSVSPPPVVPPADPASPAAPDGAGAADDALPAAAIRRIMRRRDWLRRRKRRPWPAIDNDAMLF